MIVVTLVLLAVAVAAIIYLSFSLLKQKGKLTTALTSLSEKEGIITALQTHITELESVITLNSETIKKLKSEIQSLNDKSKSRSELNKPATVKTTSKQPSASLAAKSATKQSKK